MNDIVRNILLTAFVLKNFTFDVVKYNIYLHKECVQYMLKYNEQW